MAKLMVLKQQLNVRMDDALLRRIDAWRRKQLNPPNRQDAVRQLIDLALKRSVSNSRKSAKHS
jgi:hypothetical protein